jgi:hypothetical protein
VAGDHAGRGRHGRGGVLARQGRALMRHGAT